MVLDYNYKVVFRHLSGGLPRTAGRCRPWKTFLLVAAFAVSLMVIGGATDVQHAGDLGQVVASEPTPYHLTGGAWSILDLSAPQSGYAFAQTPPPDSTPPTFVSSKFNDVTGVLTITFSEAIDVTPTTNVVPAKIHVRDSGNYADSVTLTAGDLGTAVDAVTISFTLTDQHRVTVTGWATPELLIEPGAVQDTSGNLIASTFDVSTAAFVHSFNVSSQDTSPRGMAFSNNGAKMFVVGHQNGRINEYTLSTPFDVSTASPARSFSVSSYDYAPTGMAFSNNGAKMFVVGWGDIDINEYTLSIPFKVSTASPAHSFDVFLQDFAPRGMAFSNDGAKMFIVGDQGNDINAYTLSTPFDVSTASFDNVVFSVADQDRKPEGMAFSSDGAKMFVVGWNNNAINEYTLPTPFDISTASFVHSFNVSSQDTSPRGMALSNDGTKMFVVGDQKNNINEYTLSSVYPIRVTSLPAGAFVTIWKTTSANEAITFPGLGTYTIDWGDGSSPSQNVENQQQHTYADAGNYTVSVSGDLSQIFNNCLPNAEKLISIEQWGDIRWSDMRHAFCGASQMTYDATDNPNLSSVSDMEGMFRDTSFNGDLYSWDVSSVTDMSYMFSSSSFDGDLSIWDVSSVTDMSDMFASASSFNGDLSSWDVSSVTNMYSMFYNAFDFNGDLSIWDVSSVTNMNSMFLSASSFNGDLSSWDVSSVTNMNSMFFRASSFNGDLSIWDVSSVTNMNSMFLGTFDFDGDLSSWDVSSVDNMSYMFHYSSFNGDLSSWNISSVNNMSYMFYYSSFNGDLSGWDVSGVTYMEQMFQYASFNGNLGNWYITLDNASITGTPQAVGNITPQNEFLATHGPTYGIGSSSDSEHFGINGAALVLMTIPDANPAIVNITSTGDFGTSNSRIFEITVLSGVADTTNPRLASIERYDPTSQNTTSQSLIYKATFNESVTGVDASDFVLSLVGGNAGTGSITGISGSGSQYSVTVSASSDGTYNLDLVQNHGIEDLADNLLTNTATTGVDQTYTVNTVPADSTAPTLTSIERYNPTAATTDSQTLVYEVTFSEAVTGVTQSDFVLSSDSTGAANSITSISGSGSQYSVTVSASSDGTYNLDLVQNHGIEDLADNLLTNTATTGVDQTYTVNTVPADNTAPTLTSIERYNPTAATTDSQTLVYEVTFSEAVTGVTQSDFVLSSDSTGAANSITSISGSGSQYSVTVSASSDGTYNLDLVQNHGIEDLADNLLTNTATTGVDQTYTVNTVPADNTAPTLTSIERYNPTAATTDSQTLVYEVTFSEAVTGVTQSDFVLSSDSTGGPDPNTGTGQFTQTKSPSAAITGDQDVIDTIAVSNSGSATSVSVDLNIAHSYIGDLKVDLVAPDGTTKTLHNRLGGSSDDIVATYTPNFNGTSISGTWTLKINDDYPSADDGVLNSWTLTINYGDTTNVPNPITSISGSGSQYSVTVSASSDGTYNLDLVQNHGIEDLADNLLTNTATTGVDQTYTVNTVPADSTAPTLTSIERYNPTAATTDSQTLVYEVTFSEAVTGVTQSDFVLSSDSTGAANSITSISGSGSQYSVTVSASSDGTYNLDLVQNHGIEDLADNLLTNTATTGVDQTYTVNTVPADSTAPTLTSIERYNPTAATTDSQTLVYEVTFSEAVTGVTQSDFVLSSDSTGGPDPNTGTGQFTQTKSPSAAITGDQDVIDTIAVSNSGSATSVSVDLNIAHSYIGDLKVDLVAPDGTTKTLHNRLGGSSDDIVATYTPNFNGTSISGTWTLKINDDYPSADDGVLNSWTLTINYGDTTNVPNPITSISGSGSQYSVTVSASTDGTYNLDLVQNHGIEDLADNLLTNTATTGVDQTYTVNTVPADNTAPTLTSIERYNLTAATTDSQTLVYEVTFSEAVTGVTQSDFVLSSDSTGGPDPNTGTGQFTQTKSPSAAITGDQDVIDTIAVSNSGSATSVSVDLNIAHSYIGDLKVDLVAPDGTTKTLHNRLGGSSDDIVATYTPNFNGTSISGTWTLKINDDYPSADDGVLNSWTLTINYGDTTNVPNPITSISGSGSQYSVTVSASSDGTYNLDLVQNHGIEDLADNLLTNTATTGVDQTYTVNTVPADSTAPTLTSIERYNPTAATTDSQTLVYEVTFSEEVTGVGTDDFVLSSDSTGAANSITSISSSGSQYSVTVSASSDGTYNLDLVQNHGIEDLADNLLTNTATTGVDQTYTVNTVPADSTAPTLTSIERYNPAAENTNSQKLVYKVTFSENVTGVDTSDFTLSPGSTGNGTGSGQFTQTRTPAITIPYDQIVTDTILVTGSGTATSVFVAVDIAHQYIDDLKVDLIAPDGTVQTLHEHSSGPANIDQTYAPDFGSTSIAGNWTLQMHDYYSADDGILNRWTLTVNHDSDTATHVTSISGSGSVYNVTVSAAQDGTYNLDLVSSGHNITDAATNLLTGTTPTTGTDHTYTVNTVPADATAPTLASIERSNPAAENTDSQTLVYKVAFSENVTGVDTSDFTLSPGSTGGSANNTSGQFTQTQLPSLAIPDMTTVSDTIAVPDFGTATSVFVSVNITHAWIGDLLVELIAPDGTTRTLHNREGGGADDIDQTYTPDFDGVSIAGTWALRIYDGFNADPGVLNSWTLTVNHDSDTATHVTSISGSGDVYYVTISAAQEGTYNLDLMENSGIKDNADNPLINIAATGTDQTYIVTTN